MKRTEQTATRNTAKITTELVNELARVGFSTGGYIGHRATGNEETSKTITLLWTPMQGYGGSVPSTEQEKIAITALNKRFGITARACKYSNLPNKPLYCLVIKLQPGQDIH